MMIKLKRSFLFKWVDILISNIPLSDFKDGNLEVDTSQIVETLRYGHSNYSIRYRKDNKILFTSGNINEDVDGSLGLKISNSETRAYWRYYGDSLLLYAQYSIQFHYNLPAFLLFFIFMMYPPIKLSSSSQVFNLAWIISALIVVGFLIFSMLRLRDFRKGEMPIGWYRFEFLISAFMLVLTLSSLNDILFETGKRRANDFYKSNLPTRSIASQRFSK